MNHLVALKHTLGFVIVSILLSLPASAIPYCGTITQIIDFTNDPSYAVGQTVTGIFHYESDSLNGDFGTTQYCSFVNPEANPSLDGLVFGFLNNTSDGWLCLDTTGFRNRTHLVVTEGEVTDFVTAGQIGGADYGFKLSGFNISNFNAGTGQSYLTSGRLTFSAPVAVPDVAVTGLLLMVSFFGISYLKRQGS